jgi:hypothetical protein
MRYMIIYDCDEDPNVAEISIDKKPTKIGYQEFAHSYDDIVNQPLLVKNLFFINGVARVHLSDWYVMIVKADVFEWDEIMNQVLEAIRKELDPNGTMKESKQLEKPPTETESPSETKKP